MPTLESIKTRVRQILDDADGGRFSDALIENAIRQALTRLNEQLPLIATTDQQITTSSKDQTLTGLVHPLFLMGVSVAPASPESGDREIKSGYSYHLQGSVCMLHFSGVYCPGVGETLRITYASQNTLEGLNEAAETTLPESVGTALETGSVSFACLLRAASLAEAYGARSGESARLVEQSRLWRELSDEAIKKIAACQTFEFPAGFALDAWDEKGG